MLFMLHFSEKLFHFPSYLKNYLICRFVSKKRKMCSLKLLCTTLLTYELRRFFISSESQKFIAILFLKGDTARRKNVQILVSMSIYSIFSFQLPHIASRSQFKNINLGLTHSTSSSLIVSYALSSPSVRR